MSKQEKLRESVYKTRLEGNAPSVELSDSQGRKVILERSQVETEQSAIEDILKDNQKAVDLAVRRGNISIWAYDMDDHCIIQQTFHNGHMGYPTIIGGVPQCFAGRDDIPEEDFGEYMRLYDDLENGKLETEATFRLRSQETGEYEWMHVYYERDTECTDGRIAYGFAMDVSVQRENLDRFVAEQRLRRRLFKNTVLYYQVNVTKHLLEEFRRNGNPSPTDLPRPISSDFGDAILADVDEEYREKVKRLFPSSSVKEYEEGKTEIVSEYRRKIDGEHRWVRGTTVLSVRPSTNDLISFTYIQDIDDEKKHELALQCSIEDDLESIIVKSVERKTVTIHVEKGAYVPYAEGDVLKDDRVFIQSIELEMPPADQEKLREFLDMENLVSLLDADGIARFTYRRIKPNGGIERKNVTATYLDEYHEDIVFIRRDTTVLYDEEQRSKRQLQNAMQQATDANRAKTEFFSRMSHDMRTPMNGILGLVALSADETDATELRESIAKIGEAGEYLLGLINDTLDFQRIEEGHLTLELETIKAGALIKGIVDVVQKSAMDKNLDFRITHDDLKMDSYVRADPLRLRQVFVNLLSNAIKFTPEGGVVEMSIKRLGQEGTTTHVEVIIADSGVGMSEEFIRKNIFKPFAQETNDLSRQYAGSGLGLSIVKSLVELMNGRIEVESEQGTGTTFRVYVDLERVADSDVRDKKDNAALHSKSVKNILRGAHILLAEDNRLNAEIAKRLLISVGCTVTWAADGGEAVDMFNEAQPGTFDAVLMDIRMPVKNGLEAARDIRSSGKSDAASIPIIAMTANAYAEDIQASLDAGMDAHLAKPVNPEMLYDTVAGYIERNRDVSST